MTSRLFLKSDGSNFPRTVHLIGLELDSTMLSVLFFFFKKIRSVEDVCGMVVQFLKLRTAEHYVQGSIPTELTVGTRRVEESLHYYYFISLHYYYYYKME